MASNRSQLRRNRRKQEAEQTNIVPINSFKKEFTKKKIDLLPRSVKQEEYVLGLLDNSIDILVGVGPAGSGKTMLATRAAIKALWEKKIQKIVITRPNIAVDDKDIGFLPGDITKKMTPWMMPILDEFKEYYNTKEIEYMIENGTLEIVPIAYMRGRTLKNAIVIVDEAQGTTVNSMLAILTRIGENSRMFVTGDVAQTDRVQNNGLEDFLKKLENYRGNRIKTVKFDNRDVQRHPVIKDILTIYNQ